MEIIMMLLSIATLLAALYIPRKIMVDQTFSSLVTQYRSPEMGFAILSIFDFYEKDCGSSPNLIEEKYIARYNREIRNPMLLGENIDPEKTLHFQKRMIAYFYWELANLYFNSKFPVLSEKQLYQMVEKNERNLISLVLQMSEAAGKCFIHPDNIAAPADDDVAMDQLIKRLYDKTEGKG
jgi:hypothetical protein